MAQAVAFTSRPPRAAPPRGRRRWSCRRARRASGRARAPVRRRRAPRPRAVPRSLRHPDVAIGEAGDLRQVRHDEHLAVPREARESPADREPGLSADAGVDLVEDERRARRRGRPARCGTRASCARARRPRPPWPSGSGGLPGAAGEPQLDALGPCRPGGRERHRGRPATIAPGMPSSSSSRRSASASAEPRRPVPGVTTAERACDRLRRVVDLADRAPRAARRRPRAPRAAPTPRPGTRARRRRSPRTCAAALSARRCVHGPPAAAQGRRRVTRGRPGRRGRAPRARPPGRCARSPRAPGFRVERRGLVERARRDAERRRPPLVAASAASAAAATLEQPFDVAEPRLLGAQSARISPGLGRSTASISRTW